MTFKCDCQRCRRPVEDKLRDIVMRLAERIFLAHEVIGKLAERKEVRSK